ncbi:MAG: PAS domain-containing protein, partial [Prolixibacteraceae bacterium]|nr:PAS domain-containing protein [Prolixibacteraceae bacterium]
MNFDFLFRNFEGVLSLTKRKAKILSILSLAGVIFSVSATIVLALDYERSKYIPGILMLGCMMVLNVIFLVQGNYQSAIRIVLMLPLALYFLFINNYYSIASGDDALRGIQLSLYLAFLFLMVFGYSYHLFWIFYIISVTVLAYFIHVSNYPGGHGLFDHPTLLYMGNPYLEVTVVGVVTLLIYLLFHQLINETAYENTQLKNRISDLLRQIDTGVLVLKIQRDAHGEKSGMTIQRSNAVFERTFKTTREEMLGADFSDVFPKLFHQSFNWQECFYHNPKPRFQVYINHLEQWFMVNNVFVAHDLIVSSFVNITSLKQDAERLMIREQRLTKLMGSLPDIFFIIEKDGTYLDYVSNNPELMRISQEDIIGKTIFDMGFSKPMSYQIYSSIQYVLEHDNIETIEYGMELQSGKILIFEMRLARLNENQVISIGRDITTKKEFQQQLIEAKRKTEEASRLKSAFLENISHEMRTPLNAIIGFSNLSFDDHFSETEKKNFQEIVLRNGEKLIEIITNVIDIAEIESGSLTVRMKPYALNSMLDRLYVRYSRIIAASPKPILFEMETGNPSPDFEVFTDGHLLQKIMGHLIDNAIKFTNEGKV